MQSRLRATPVSINLTSRRLTQSRAIRYAACNRPCLTEQSNTWTSIHEPIDRCARDLQYLKSNSHAGGEERPTAWAVVNNLTRAHDWGLADHWNTKGCHMAT